VRCGEDGRGSSSPSEFGEEREFRGWYANLAEPIRRTERGFDTLDHELDVWIRPDGTYELEDEALLDAWVGRGRWSAEEVEEIRAEAARVVADAAAGRRWWSEEWASWSPDPTWTRLELPPGCDATF
jgi:predicted RNA-binding protein associated with RNAse of E/G family